MLRAILENRLVARPSEDPPPCDTTSKIDHENEAIPNGLPPLELAGRGNMANKTKHWGEFEENIDEQLAYVPKNSLNKIIEAALITNCDIQESTKEAFVELPVPNITLETVKLVEHNRQAAAAALAGEVPPSPPESVLYHSKFDKKLASTSFQNDLSRPIPILGASARKLALTQAVALTLASRPGIVSATRSAIETLADAVEQFLRVVTMTMRTVVDKEAASHPSGFPDIMSKVFTELGISGLQTWYKENILGNYEAAQKGFEEVPVAEIPQLHFPASLELTDSLEPGYQMLQTLESGQLPTLHLLDGDSDNLELNEALIDDSSPPVSPTVKKKRKLNDG